MRLFIVLFLLLLIFPLTSAVSLVTSEGASITDALVQVREGENSRDFLVSLGKPLELASETSGMTILIKAGAGETFDYYAKLPSGTVPETIVVHPTGLVLGEVRDASDNLIVHASVSIDCPTTSVHLESDGAGAFRVFLPAEQCKFSAAKEERAASISLVVEQGLVNNLSLSLATKQASWLWLFLLILLVATLVLWMSLGRPRRKYGSRGKKEFVEPKKKCFVVEEVKLALKEKEVLIVDELLLREGKARVSELRTATKIARTSLLRTLEGLEHRGLLLKKTENGKPVAELVKK
ncbi:hypothetical protein GOV10_01650 [Candidatus Woesearchaeota archaeon]|nr:hypothetical protein [Candidatus Woesearchaeota archaeon]